MRNRLISTVGTSLFTNIRAPYSENSSISEELHRDLAALLKSENWGELAKRLARIDPTSRICGAEINSVEEAVKRGRIQLNHIHFLVSDTQEGKNAGKLLESYFIERGIDGLQTVQYHVIEELQDQQPGRFKTFGLRNLVREIGKLVQQHQPENILIDATGGYKAQIAIAVVFGQALEIPVLYRFERFSEIVDIPPMPISFDYNLLGENAGLLAAFERNATLTRSEIDELDERIRVLLDEVEIEGESLFALGAVGQIFLTGFRLRFPRTRTLAPIPEKEKQPPSFGKDHHYPKGFEDFVHKLCNEVPWIKTAHTLPYHKQKSIKGIGFYVYEGKLVGTYQDQDNFGARFEILTNAESADQLTWAADQLNQRYGE